MRALIQIAILLIYIAIGAAGIIGIAYVGGTSLGLQRVTGIPLVLGFLGLVVVLCLWTITSSRAALWLIKKVGK